MLVNIQVNYGYVPFGAAFQLGTSQPTISSGSGFSRFSSLFSLQLSTTNGGNSDSTFVNAWSNTNSYFATRAIVAGEIIAAIAYFAFIVFGPVEPDHVHEIPLTIKYEEELPPAAYSYPPAPGSAYYPPPPPPPPGYYGRPTYSGPTPYPVSSNPNPSPFGEAGGEGKIKRKSKACFGDVAL